MQALRRVSPTERALATTFFAKGYALQALSEEVLPGNIFRPLDRSAFHLGAGGTARLFVTELLLVKASYEYATRLPRPDEIFGNGVLIQPNLDLIPEVSHNANLGARLELERLGDVDIGDLMVDVGAFWRETDKLIVLLGNDRLFMYQNVFGARSVGVESAASYTAFDLVTVDGGLTLQDFRNVSTEGTFGSFAGDRIPNRPWLFGSWGARVRLVDVARKGDALEPFYAGRFVGGFFRGWESQGLRAFKQSVPDQIVHSAGVTYSLHAPFGGASLSVEVHNLADQPTFDFFGVQRPGRSLHVKLTGDLG
jgi:hypothetical protein